MQIVPVVTSPAFPPLSEVPAFVSIEQFFQQSIQEPIIVVNTPRGQQLLSECATVDHGPLLRWFERQEKLTFCSVASSCIAMNALLGYDAHDQHKFFKPTVEAIRAQSEVESSGMTLAQLGSVLAISL